MQNVRTPAEQAQRIDHSPVTGARSSVALDDTVPRLSKNSEDLRSDQEGYRAQVDSKAHDVRSLIDENDEDGIDRSVDHDEDGISSDDALLDDGGWDIVHPYFGNKTIRFLDITRPIGNFPLHILLEYEATPGLDNLDPFILHSINILAHEWILVLETYIQGRGLLKSVATVRGIYAIVREDDYS